MTKFEFLLKVPDIIEHKTLGFAELEIISDVEEKKKFVIGIKIRRQAIVPMVRPGPMFILNFQAI